MKRFFLISIIAVFLMPFQAWCLDVVPGLKVFGGTTRAAYGNNNSPTIYCINTLNPTTALTNSTRNGVSVKQGGLKSAIDHSVNNKLIIFEVSGYITYNGHYTIDDNYITIAGQTAPSPGITLRNSELDIKGYDVLIQHIRVRMDDCGTGDGSDCGDPFVSRDGINIYGSNVVVDHCSISWATDENVGIGGEAVLHDSTIVNSIISEGLYNSNHPKGVHSMGLISAGGTNLGIINNLFIHNDARNPYFTNNGSVLAKALISNNLIYNAKTINFHDETKTTADDWNIVGNVVIGGPNSGTYAQSTFPSILRDTSNDADRYIYDTRIEEIGEPVYTQSSADDWTRVRMVSGSDDEQYTKVLSPAFPYPTGYTPMSSANVEAYVSVNVGARPADRDSVDMRLINDVINKTGKIINSPSEVNGWSMLENNSTTLSIPINPHTDDDSDGYTNLEEYLHEFAAQVEGKSKDTTLSAPDGLTIKTE
jgi:hypothetical protein